ncbi:MAG TPA: hypothetical protein VF494_10440 [Candidatus Limnocylindrales bacterium]
MNGGLPVYALTFLGILITLLGLFAAGDIIIVLVGLGAIALAGVLSVAAGRRKP